MESKTAVFCLLAIFVAVTAARPEKLLQSLYAPLSNVQFVNNDFIRSAEAETKTSEATTQVESSETSTTKASSIANSGTGSHLKSNVGNNFLEKSESVSSSSAAQSKVKAEERTQKQSVAIKAADEAYANTNLALGNTRSESQGKSSTKASSLTAGTKFISDESKSSLNSLSKSGLSSVKKAGVNSQSYSGSDSKTAAESNYRATTQSKTQSNLSSNLEAQSYFDSEIQRISTEQKAAAIAQAETAAEEQAKSNQKYVSQAKSKAVAVAEAQSKSINHANSNTSNRYNSQGALSNAAESYYGTNFNAVSSSENLAETQIESSVKSETNSHGNLHSKHEAESKTKATVEATALAAAKSIKSKTKASAEARAESVTTSALNSKKKIESKTNPNSKHIFQTTEQNDVEANKQVLAELQSKSLVRVKSSTSENKSDIGETGSNILTASENKSKGYSHANVGSKKQTKSRSENNSYSENKIETDITSLTKAEHAAKAKAGVLEKALQAAVLESKEDDILEKVALAEAKAAAEAKSHAIAQAEALARAKSSAEAEQKIFSSAKAKIEALKYAQHKSNKPVKSDGKGVLKSQSLEYSLLNKKNQPKTSKKAEYKTISNSLSSTKTNSEAELQIRNLKNANVYSSVTTEAKADSKLQESKKSKAISEEKSYVKSQSPKPYHLNKKIQPKTSENADNKIRRQNSQSRTETISEYKKNEEKENSSQWKHKAPLAPSKTKHSQNQPKKPVLLRKESKYIDDENENKPQSKYNTEKQLPKKYLSLNKKIQPKTSENADYETREASQSRTDTISEYIENEEIENSSQWKHKTPIAPSKSKEPQKQPKKPILSRKKSKNIDDENENKPQSKYNTKKQLPKKYLSLNKKIQPKTSENADYETREASQSRTDTISEYIENEEIENSSQWKHKTPIAPSKSKEPQKQPKKPILSRKKSKNIDDENENKPQSKYNTEKQLPKKYLSLNKKIQPKTSENADYETREASQSRQNSQSRTDTISEYKENEEIENSSQWKHKTPIAPSKSKQPQKQPKKPILPRKKSRIIDDENENKPQSKYNTEKQLPKNYLSLNKNIQPKTSENADYETRETSQSRQNSQSRTDTLSEYIENEEIETISQWKHKAPLAETKAKQPHKQPKKPVGKKTKNNPEDKYRPKSRSYPKDSSKANAKSNYRTVTDSEIYADSGFDYTAQSSTTKDYQQNTNSKTWAQSKQKTSAQNKALIGNDAESAMARDVQINPYLASGLNEPNSLNGGQLRKKSFEDLKYILELERASNVHPKSIVSSKSNTKYDSDSHLQANSKSELLSKLKSAARADSESITSSNSYNHAHTNKKPKSVHISLNKLHQRSSDNFLSNERSESGITWEGNTPRATEYNPKKITHKKPYFESWEPIGSSVVIVSKSGSITIVDPEYIVLSQITSKPTDLQYTTHRKVIGDGIENTYTMTLKHSALQKVNH